TDNPGPWTLHCQIEFHLALGFAVVLAEDPQDILKMSTVTLNRFPVSPEFLACSFKSVN
ncbi:hypothetical protein DAEQUDRAFT_678642, partial [Daedalea quercina L-15889]